MSIQVTAENFRAAKDRSRSLQGNVDIKLTFDGTGVSFTVRRCTLFQNQRGAWLNYPGEKYEKDGQQKYFPFLRFDESDAPSEAPWRGTVETKIQEAAIAAMNAFDASGDGGGASAAPASSGRGSAGRAAPGGRGRRAPAGARARARGTTGESKDFS